MKPFVFLFICLFWSCSNADYFYKNNHLKSGVRFVLPEDKLLIYDAVNYFISPHDYAIELDNLAPDEAKNISLLPKDIALRSGHLMTVEEALLYLIPSHIGVVIDTENKLVSFYFRKENEK